MKQLFFAVVMASLWSAMLLIALYWHVRIFLLYRSLEGVRQKFPYTEFAFQFQTPGLAKWLGGPMFRDGLSGEQSIQVQQLERHIRTTRIICAVCGSVLFLLFLVGIFVH